MKLSFDDCRAYWLDPSEPNKPEKYLENENTKKRSEYLVSKMKKIYSDKRRRTKPICELGCNVGRNLEYLRKEGFKDLHGCDLNNEALALSKQAFPKLNHINLINNNILDYLRLIPDNELDTIYTMAVLLHVHPEEIQQIISEMQRVAKKYIITIEYENNMGNAPIDRIEKRNYKELIENNEWIEVESEPVKDQCDKAMIYYTYRLFKKVK